MSILIIRTDDVISEKWTYGRYEADGQLVDNARDGDLVFSHLRFTSHMATTKYVHDKHPEEGWSYAIYHLLDVSEYQVKDNI